MEYAISAKVSGRKFERISVIAAKCGKDVLAPMGYTGTCDAIFFNKWLQDVLIPELKPGQVVIMDNASIHKFCEVEKLLKKEGCRLLYLPPYSPGLNPIEHLWAEMKIILKKIISNFSSLFDVIHHFFKIRLLI